ncbi:MAG: hypothetical protein KJ645_02885, partial [Planctomycetes bacterium]|nr:hypothetical protein [Planctomycetota bacterium]
MNNVNATPRITVLVLGILSCFAVAGFADPGFILSVRAGISEQAVGSDQSEISDQIGQDQLEDDFRTDARSVSLASVREIVHRGHIYLSKTQNPDGSFSLDPNMPSDYIRAPIAVTSLVCLSFMAGGNTPCTGPFRTQLKKGLSYLIRVCDADTGIFRDDLDDTSKMHGQGFAILALAQAYGMFGLENRSQDRKALETALKSSVKLVCDIQTEVGGWYYSPVFSSEHEGSITICVVQALRAARNAGIYVDKGVID